MLYGIFGGMLDKISGGMSGRMSGRMLSVTFDAWHGHREWASETGY
jgi:hypothetical protein